MISSSLLFQSFLSMDGEIITPGQSSKSKTSLGDINILVVDDDATSLAIVAGILKSWKYKVVAVKHPVDALCTLRIQHDLFDLVVTDVHMPDMNGFELQKQVDEEFKLPVVMITADDKESVMLRGLEGGAALFIVKPINPDDLKNIWQFSVASRKGKSIAIEEETGSVQGVTLAKRIPYGDRESASSVNNDQRQISRKDYKKKAPIKANEDRRREGKNAYKTPRKAKVIWSTTLHNQFLRAIARIGLERAVPKRILEFMRVPGLTRENIASHLQKYRIFLKRVEEKTNNASKNLPERALRSNFAQGHSSLMQHQMRTTFQPRFGVNIPTVYNDPSLGPVSFPHDHEASSSNSITQFGHGQADHLYQANCSSFGIMEPNNISSGIMNGTNNTMQMHQQQTQARLEPFTSAGSSNYNFRTYGVLGPNTTPAGIDNNIGSFNSVQTIPSFNYNNNNNYAGLQMTSGGELVRLSGQMGFSTAGEVANGTFNASYGSMNEQMETGNFGYFTRGESSSLGFESANYQFSPTFTDVIQQENALVLPPSPPPPPQQNSFGNDGGETNYMFGPINNNTSNFNNISLSQPFGGGGDHLSDTFLKQINDDQSPNEQQGGGEEVLLNPDFTINSYRVEENPQGIVQTLNQQEGGDQEVMGHEVGDNLYQSDDYFPWFDDQYPNQQQAGGEFVNSELNGLYQGDDEEIMDSLFGVGPYLRE